MYTADDVRQLRVKVSGVVTPPDYEPSTLYSTASMGEVALLINAAVAIERAVMCEKEPFAWATFAAEGCYDLRLYENNESYKDEYIARNGDKYKDWVKLLYLEST